MRFFKQLPPSSSGIDPDQVFLDASNLPRFDQHQFEGRLEKPISRNTVFFMSVCVLVVGLIFIGRLWDLQVGHGVTYKQLAESNSLHPSILFASRGVITDRNGTLLAWNGVNPANPAVPMRKYSTANGMSTVLGYVKYPTQDTAGFYYREDYLGVTGAEKFFNEQLTGQNGSELREQNAAGAVLSESVIKPSQPGKSVILSIDSRVQSEMYSALADIAAKVGSPGGAGLIMDVHTGEIMADVSFPEYSSQVMSDGVNTAAINSYLNDPRHLLLDRSVDGLYAPGSIIKPVMALGALDTGTIAASTILYTNGSISVPNPYDPSVTYVYHDWRNNGPLDMEHAIAESSDVYFYEVGGGYQGQKGMGIANIDKYAALFGYGQLVPSTFFSGPAGVVPSPDWKKATFKGETWTIGDTYHSAIGQFGWQVTPLQVLRAITAVANDGTLLTPTIILGDTNALSTATHINLPQSEFDVIHKGMRLSATIGTGDALNVGYMQFATKTGTAQLGANNELENSWVGGFWPYDNPKYAFVMMLERRPIGNVLGSFTAARELFDWMATNTPEYMVNN